MDPLSAIVGAVNGFWRTHQVGEWFKAALGIHVAALTGFLGGCGYQLYFEHAGFPAAVGYGMLAANAAVVVSATSNHKLKGMVFAWWKPPKLPDELNNIEVDKVG